MTYGVDSWIFAKFGVAHGQKTDSVGAAMLLLVPLSTNDGAAHLQIVETKHLQHLA
jgi:hypothetical protein